MNFRELEEFEEWWVFIPLTWKNHQRRYENYMMHKYPPCTSMGMANYDTGKCLCGEVPPDEVVKLAKKYCFIDKLDKL